MSYNEGLLNTISGVAGSDMSAKQFYAVSIVNDTAGTSGNPPGGVKLALATAAKAITGILQDNPVSGQAGCVQTNGVTKAVISISQTVSAGVTMLEVDTGGTLIPKSSGTPVAQALEDVTSVASLRVISVRLLPANDVLV